MSGAVAGRGGRFSSPSSGPQYRERVELAACTALLEARRRSAALMVVTARRRDWPEHGMGLDPLEMASGTPDWAAAFNGLIVWCSVCQRR